MAPRNADSLAENEVTDNIATPMSSSPNKERTRQIVWLNVCYIVGLHMAALYGLYLAFASAKIQTIIATYIGYLLGGLGITAGAHRLWAHRSYKARLPLRIFLALCNSSAAQNHIIEWSRDHRVHHKFSETDADPHNAKRGFFFAHVGWLMQKKHPDVKEKGKMFDLKDLENDIVCSMQRKYYGISVLLFCFVLPTVIPWYFWDESLITSYFLCGIFRYVFILNNTWLVNSLAHFIGNRPYDKNINPVQNILVCIGAMGEGFHNYHHTYPTDYSTSELGWTFNTTTMFIDCMAYFGLAYDCKKISPELVKKRMLKTGDGTTGFNML